MGASIPMHNYNEFQGATFLSDSILMVLRMHIVSVAQVKINDVANIEFLNSLK